MPRLSSPRSLKIIIGWSALLLLFLSSRVPGQPSGRAGSGRLGRFCPLDLQPKANQKHTDEFPSRYNNLHGNNLVALASGEHWLLGIPFQVGEGILHLDSKFLPNQPEKISGIRVGLNFARPPILHVRHRMEPLVEKLENAPLRAEERRLQRTLLVLELIGTAEARQLLQEVAKGSAGACLVPEAEASVKRIEKAKD